MVYHSSASKEEYGFQIVCAHRSKVGGFKMEHMFQSQIIARGHDILPAFLRFDGGPFLCNTDNFESRIKEYC